MFTGIVEETGRVISVPAGGLVIGAGGVLKDMETGASMAVNGVCLTVTAFDKSSFSVDVMPETLRRTNLGLLGAGDKVNLERPLALGGRVGGHLVQGHIDGTGKVSSLKPSGEAVVIGFEAPPPIMDYIVEKGFIAVDGVSLTVVSRDAASFSVSLVNYTAKNTILGSYRVGDTVNLEVDIIAKYVKQFTSGKKTEITMELLQEHGFLVG